MTEITELQHLTTERVLLARHKSGRQKSLAKLQGSKDTADLDEKLAVEKLSCLELGRLRLPNLYFLVSNES